MTRLTDPTLAPALTDAQWERLLSHGERSRCSPATTCSAAATARTT